METTAENWQGESSKGTLEKIYRFIPIGPSKEIIVGGVIGAAVTNGLINSVLLDPSTTTESQSLASKIAAYAVLGTALNAARLIPAIWHPILAGPEIIGAATGVAVSSYFKSRADDITYGLTDENPRLSLRLESLDAKIDENDDVVQTTHEEVSSGVYKEVKYKLNDGLEERIE